MICWTLLSLARDFLQNGSDIASVSAQFNSIPCFNELSTFPLERLAQAMQSERKYSPGGIVNSVVWHCITVDNVNLRLALHNPVAISELLKTRMCAPSETGSLSAAIACRMIDCCSSATLASKIRICVGTLPPYPILNGSQDEMELYFLRTCLCRTHVMRGIKSILISSITVYYSFVETNSTGVMCFCNTVCSIQAIAAVLSADFLRWVPAKVCL